MTTTVQCSGLSAGTERFSGDAQMTNAKGYTAALAEVCTLWVLLVSSKLSGAEVEFGASAAEQLTWLTLCNSVWCNTEESMKYCAEDGNWFEKSGLEWTDYTPCVDKQVLSEHASLSSSSSSAAAAAALSLSSFYCFCCILWTCDCHVLSQASYYCC